MKIINIKGERLAKPILPYLAITWHNSLDGVYCYSGSLFFRHNDESCAGGLAELKVYTNNINFKPPRTYETRLSRFLECRKVGESMCIPINMQTLVDALVINTWTKTKTGKKNKLKSHASKIEWTLNGKSYSYTFDADNGETPGMLCEPYTESLGTGEKEEIIICLSQEIDFPRSLFEFM